MRPSIAVVLVVAASCGTGGSGDAGRDSPDAPVDDNRELYEFILEPGPQADCGEWTVPAHPTRTLALSPPGTASLLWEWSPIEEPLLDGWVQSSPNRLANLALGPDGTIWAMGPDGSAVVTIGHDGHMLAATRIVERPGPAHLSGFPIRPLPDGDAMYEVEPGWMVRISPRGGYRTLWDNRGTRTQNGFTAVGPGRRIYISEETADGGSWTIATCNADRERYVWRMQVRSPWYPLGRAVGGRILEDGTMLSALEDAFLRISTAGEVTWLSEPRAYRADYVSTLQQFAAGTQVVETGRGEHVWLRALTIATGEETWGVPLPYGTGTTSITWSMDALGHIALLTYDGTDNRFEMLDPSGTVLWTRPFFGRPDFGAFTDGGGWIGGLGPGPEGGGIARMSAEGLETWRIFTGVANDGGGNGVLDVDGRYYATIVGGVSGASWGTVARLVAVQTDALPPRGDVCLNSGGSYACNAHHSNWTRLYQPTPPSE